MSTFKPYLAHVVSFGLVRTAPPQCSDDKTVIGRLSTLSGEVNVGDVVVVVGVASRRDIRFSPWCLCIIQPGKHGYVNSVHLEAIEEGM